MSDTNGGDGTTGAAEEAEAREVRRIRRLLKQMGDIAHDASLTGAFGDGAPEAIERYNLIIGHLTERGVITGPLFPPLPADASFDRVGIACKLLGEYLVEEASEQQGGKGRSVLAGPVNEGGLFIGNLELGDLHLHDLEQLKDLGKLLREKLPVLLGGKKTEPEETTVEAAGAEGGGAAAAPAPEGDPSLLFPSGDLSTAPTEVRRP